MRTDTKTFVRLTWQERDKMQEVLNIMQEVCDELHEDDCVRIAAEHARNGIAYILDEFLEVY